MPKRMEDDTMSFITNRRTILALWLSLAATAAFAQATSREARFSAATLAAAQASNRPIVVEVSAPWCPTCKAQAPIIKSLTEKPEFMNVIILKVDFDSQKDALKALNVTMQSTLIAYKGATETSRSIGDTTASGIEKLFKSAI